uniref:Ig-like domain-containing protein n=1 Tax=Scleropages formosus TaxID=113540 RepID=A0A8C9RDU2_SCLFO
KEVTQTPPALFVRSGDSLQFSCSHKINSYDTILWYQQSESGGALKLIGYVYYTANTTEDSYKDHFSVTGNGESEVLLHITKVKSEDTAVYFCAAISTVMQTLSLLYKNPSLFQCITCQNTPV